MTLFDIEGGIIDLIREHISARETNQTEFARSAGITQGHLSQILASRKNAALPTLERLRIAAGIVITATVTTR